MGESFRGISGLYTDFYELSMAQGYFLDGRKDEKAVFDYFYRTNPYKGGFLIFAGLADFLLALKDFVYSLEEISFLKERGFNPDFLHYLKNFQFKGTIYSVREGEIVFPNEPLLIVEGNIIETQLIETMLLNFLNYQSLIATKAFRIKMVSEEKSFTDFGLRRAHGLGGIQASRAAVIGGASSTSNVYSAMKYEIIPLGTMAHSWVQSYDDELTAFRKYAEYNPSGAVFLVDTYHTLKSGVPNAIKVAKEMEQMGHRLIGIRLDSGDLAYLSKKTRQMLDEEGLEYVKIFCSNQLNEHVIKSLEEQGARIDGFGVGTDLVTGRPDAALDGVYKLAECDGKPRMKLSETIEKMSLPGRKVLYRFYNGDCNFFRDGIFMQGEPENFSESIFDPVHPEKMTNISGLKKELLHQIVFDRGEAVTSLPSPPEAHQYLLQRAAYLPEEHKRFIMPHIYKVGISKQLLELRNDIRKKLEQNIEHI